MRLAALHHAAGNAEAGLGAVLRAALFRAAVDAGIETGDVIGDGMLNGGHVQGRKCLRNLGRRWFVQRGHGESKRGDGGGHGGKVCDVFCGTWRQNCAFNNKCVITIYFGVGNGTVGGHNPFSSSCTMKLACKENESVYELEDVRFEGTRRTLSHVDPLIVYARVARKKVSGTVKRVRCNKRVTLRLSTYKENVDLVEQLLLAKEYGGLKTEQDVVTVPEKVFATEIKEEVLRDIGAVVGDSWKNENCTFYGIAYEHVEGMSLHKKLSTLDTVKELDDVEWFGIVDVEDMMCASVPQRWDENNSVHVNGKDDGTRFAYKDMPGNKPSDFIYWRMLACLAPLAAKCEELQQFYSSVLMVDGRSVTKADFDFLASDAGGYFSTHACKVLIQTEEDAEKHMGFLREVNIVPEFAKDRAVRRGHEEDAAWNNALCRFFARLIHRFLLPVCTACNKHNLVWYDCKPDNVIVRSGGK